eukprot:929715-Lingulodinium_polyedra.AAC.1
MLIDVRLALGPNGHLNTNHSRDGPGRMRCVARATTPTTHDWGDNKSESGNPWKPTLPHAW